jgi:hypothetical protein
MIASSAVRRSSSRFRGELLTPGDQGSVRREVRASRIAEGERRSCGLPYVIPSTLLASY